MISVRAVVLVSLVLAAPLGAQAADLVVWWEHGYSTQEDEAVREVITAFEQDTGKQVDLVRQNDDQQTAAVEAAIAAGRPPDFLFGQLAEHQIPRWAADGRLVDLTDIIGPFKDLFGADTLEFSTLRNGRDGRTALYALPMARDTTHVHVWKSLLEQAGLTLGDIPTEWDAFWSFWCDRAQPALRQATRREDIWGIALNMSGDAPGETDAQFMQFVDAYGAEYVTRDGRPIIDNPEIRQKLIRAIDSYTAIYRKGCTPPGSVSWDNGGNNQEFLAQTVVMTPNETLSIPNALKHERPDDYVKNVATIEWPLGPDGEAFPIGDDIYFAVVFKEGGHVANAKEFVRFLVAEGWLAHYLDFAGERMLPPMQKLLDQPFWLDPSDPHRMAGVMQISSRPMEYNYASVSGDWRYGRIWEERVWAKAIHRVAAEGITPEQAVDEAIARIKQILSE
jgi:multiple sugar transport system substrate-binding protein